MRIQAQLQAEEAARLRVQAEQAEAALDGAQVEQQGKVDAAREKEAALARKEAELVAGAKLPPVRRDARGDVFTLSGDAFASGQAQLTRAAADSLKALGIYLSALPGGAVQVRAHTDSQGTAASNQALSEKRAQQVRQPGGCGSGAFTRRCAGQGSQRAGGRQQDRCRPRQEPQGRHIRSE
jgi:outer membrane protein OmpA-like peptidoglycan-associated protein